MHPVDDKFREVLDRKADLIQAFESVPRAVGLGWQKSVEKLLRPMLPEGIDWGVYRAGRDPRLLVHEQGNYRKNLKL